MITLKNLTAATTVETNKNISVGLLESVISGEILAEYDTQVEIFAQKLTETNEEKITSREIMTLAESLLEGESFEKKDATGKTETMIYVSEEKYKELENLLKQSGETISASRASAKDPYVISKNDLENLRSKHENNLQNLNTTSELDMIRFQSLLDARKQMLMQLSNMISQDSQVKLEIIRNMKG